MIIENSVSIPGIFEKYEGKVEKITINQCKKNYEGGIIAIKLSESKELIFEFEKWVRFEINNDNVRFYNQSGPFEGLVIKIKENQL